MRKRLKKKFRKTSLADQIYILVDQDRILADSSFEWPIKFQTQDEDRKVKIQGIFLSQPYNQLSRSRLEHSRLMKEDSQFSL